MSVTEVTTFSAPARSFAQKVKSQLEKDRETLTDLVAEVNALSEANEKKSGDELENIKKKFGTIEQTFAKYRTDHKNDHEGIQVKIDGLSARLTNLTARLDLVASENDLLDNGLGNTDSLKDVPKIKQSSATKRTTSTPKK
ncbi:hypothetical protein CYMTET_47732 [Cymbomonas tetramitiformis]|uniref:Uncharacterized protein n=1 Tax=Cymbomonas tetramitiformis TaxID=36881 RepID=A0AAE0EVN4_9CHLO|nr:hypothetical protein CYMTET_47732 [Cymbomonas tetramitiformis]